jgi:hypothetical protein
LDDCDKLRKRGWILEGAEDLWHHSGSSRTSIGLGEVSITVTMMAVAEMRWRLMCSYRAQIVARGCQWTLEDKGEDMESTAGCDGHGKWRIEVASLARWQACRGRRWYLSSLVWAPPVSHIPKGYVAWAGSAG